MFRHILLILALLCNQAIAQAIPPGPAYKAFINNPINFVKLRLGVPALTRGPDNSCQDAPVSFYKYGTNQFYVFCSASGSSEASSSDMYSGWTGSGYGPGVTGTPYSYLGSQYSGVNSVVGTNLQPIMQATSIAAISPNLRNDSSGDWIENVYKIGAKCYGLAHLEGPSNYTYGGSSYSAAMWVSSDPNCAPGTWSGTASSTWAPDVVASLSNGTVQATLQPIGSLITNVDTGFGDVSMIPVPAVNPQWMYMYMGYYNTPNGLTDWHVAVARAPINHLDPGNWMFLYQGAFSSPALNNSWNATTELPAADLFDWYGTWISTMPGTPFAAIACGMNHVTIPLGAPPYPQNPGVNGLTLQFSQDYIHFLPLWEPLLNYDEQDKFGSGASADDGYYYNTLRSDTDGSPLLSANSFNLWETHIYPNNSLNNRYNEVIPVTKSTMTLNQRAQGIPQVGVTLETFFNSTNASGHRTTTGTYRSTTVNPYGGEESDGATEAGWAASSALGFLMTKCPDGFGLTPRHSNLNSCDSIGAEIAYRIVECWDSSNDDAMLNIDTTGLGGSTASCPSGFIPHRTVGWAFQQPQPFGTKPLFSCTQTSSGYHFASNSATCGGQTVVGSLGNVLAN